MNAESPFQGWCFFRLFRQNMSDTFARELSYSCGFCVLHFIVEWIDQVFLLLMVCISDINVMVTSPQIIVSSFTAFILNSKLSKVSKKVWIFSEGGLYRTQKFIRFFPFSMAGNRSSRFSSKKKLDISLQSSHTKKPTPPPLCRFYFLLSLVDTLFWNTYLWDRYQWARFRIQLLQLVWFRGFLVDCKVGLDGLRIARL